MDRNTNRCPGCMGQRSDMSAACPVCGFSCRSYNQLPKWIRPNTILNGKYLLGKVLGEGGFGITYLGLDLNLNVRIAVKEYFPISLVTRDVEGRKKNHVTLPSGANRENYKNGLEKFVEEARNLSKFYGLQGIVSVKDFFFENNTAYMVMEYVEGITLSEYLKDKGGLLKEEEALRLIRPVMESLKQVHGAGIIHRDISPDNIMVTGGEQMTLIDFGAARFTGNDTERSLTIVLKHGYAPAEQYRSHGNQGPWTDVYALCASMYRMMCGKIPPSAMDRLHKDTLVSFKKMGINVSDRTSCAVLDKGMALQIADRYKSMDELLQALYGSGNSFRERGKKKLYLAAALTAVLAAGAVFSLNHVMGPEGVVRISGRIPEKRISGREGPKDGKGQLELMEKQSRAMEGKKLLAASGNHFVSVRDDGSAMSGGVNEQGQLNLGSWDNLESISTGMSHTLGLRKDGTVLAAGDASDGKCAVDSWSGITQVSAGDTMSLGLREDKSVAAVGDNQMGQCNTGGWEHITAIAAGKDHSLGLREDGTVIASGSNDCGQCDVGEWKDIISLAAGRDISAGLKADGTVLLAGDTKGYEGTDTWQGVVAIDIGDGYLAGLLANGSVVTAGAVQYRQEAGGQWEDVVSIAAGSGCLYARKEDGTIVRTLFGTNSIPKDEMKELKKAAAGESYLAGLKMDGTVELCGNTRVGTEALDTSDWTGITDISAGRDAVFGIRSDGTVAVSGGGYEEVKDWSGIRQIEAMNGLAVGLREDGTVVASGNMADSYEFGSWTGITQLVSGACRDSGEQDYVLIAGLRGDGTVVFTKAYDQYLSKAGQWSGITDVAAGHDFLAGVREDGTVTVAAQTPGGYESVYSWTGIVKTAAGAGHTVGLKEDGTVAAAGSNSNGQCDVGGWTDIAFIDAGPYYTLGIKTDGTLVTAGRLPGEL